MSAFVAIGIEIQLITALILIPIAAIGHVVGLRAHEFILRNDQLFKRATGAVLIIISSLGLISL